jgi:hypothetical protein
LPEKRLALDALGLDERPPSAANESSSFIVADWVARSKSAVVTRWTGFERDNSVSSSFDAVEVRNPPLLDSALLPTPPPPPLSTTTTREVFATKEIASRHLKELFPNSRTIRVVSIILDRLE